MKWIWIEEKFRAYNLEKSQQIRFLYNDSSETWDIYLCDHEGYTDVRIPCEDEKQAKALMEALLHFLENDKKVFYICR